MLNKNYELKSWKVLNQKLNFDSLILGNGGS